MIIAAAYVWMVSNFIIIVLMTWIYSKTKKRYHLFYIFFHLCCALWGMTVPALNVPFVRDINSIVIPILGSFFAIVGSVFRLEEAITEKK